MANQTWFRGIFIKKILTHADHSRFMSIRKNRKIIGDNFGEIFGNQVQESPDETDYGLERDDHVDRFIVNPNLSSG